MSSLAELQGEARKLGAWISDIMNDSDKTGAEKSAALDDIQADYDKVTKAIADCEAAQPNRDAKARADEMRAKLGGFGDEVVDTKTKKTIERFDVASPYTAANRRSIAHEVLKHRDIEKLFAVKNSGREEYNLNMLVGTKDASETNNLMGEGLYGTTGPTAIGQQPFAAGAFGPGILPDWRPGIVEKLFYQLTLGDLITEFSTTSVNVSYLTESTANLTANAVAESQLYPFSSIALSRTYAEIGKVANAITISDEAIADAPTLFNFVQGRLLFAIRRQEEVQLLAGAWPGVGGLMSFAPSFTQSSSGSLFGATSTTAPVTFPPSGTAGTGVVAQTINSLQYGRVIPGPSGAPANTYATAVAVAEQLFDAFVDIELQVFQKPNAILMHPRDWQLLRVAKDSNGQYFGGSFFGANYGYGMTVNGENTLDRQMLWNTPVVTTPLIPQHTILVGWFDPQTIQIARREGIRMQMTNANGTDFVQGNVTVRAEERLGLLVYRPPAFQLIQVNHT